MRDPHTAIVLIHEGGVDRFVASAGAAFVAWKSRLLARETHAPVRIAIGGKDPALTVSPRGEIKRIGDPTNLPPILAQVLAQPAEPDRSDALRFRDEEHTFYGRNVGTPHKRITHPRRAPKGTGFNVTPHQEN